MTWRGLITAFAALLCLEVAAAALRPAAAQTLADLVQSTMQAHTGPDAATIVDGLPMTRNGEAGRAIGAALGASGVGGVIGGLFLLAIMPLLRPVVLAFGPAEFFLLALFGITFIAMW